MILLRNFYVWKFFVFIHSYSVSQLKYSIIDSSICSFVEFSRTIEMADMNRMYYNRIGMIGL